MMSLSGYYITKRQQSYPDLQLTFTAAIPLSVTDWELGVTDYSCDAAGRPVQVVLPNGVTSTLGYDAAGQRTWLAHESVSGTLGSYAYGYDAMGNRTLSNNGLICPQAETTTMSATSTSAGGGSDLPRPVGTTPARRPSRRARSRGRSGRVTGRRGRGGSPAPLPESGSAPAGCRPTAGRRARVDYPSQHRPPAVLEQLYQAVVCATAVGHAHHPLYRRRFQPDGRCQQEEASPSSLQRSSLL